MVLDRQVVIAPMADLGNRIVPTYRIILLSTRLGKPGALPRVRKSKTVNHGDFNQLFKIKVSPKDGLERYRAMAEPIFSCDQCKE